MQTLASFLSATLLIAVPLRSQVLRVPSQHPSIAAALAAAVGGDTILVAAGVYTENLVWPSTDGIRVVGEAGASGTIIDGGAAGTVISFRGGLTRLTQIEGLTVRNGFLQCGNRCHGAGIAIDGASPTIRRCRITGNATDGGTSGYDWGGGVFIGGSANPLLIGNEIDNNELRNGLYNHGAGIYVESRAQAEIIGNHIHDNRCLLTGTTIGWGLGAGIFVSGSALIASNLITGNIVNAVAWAHGGGVYVDVVGTASIYNNTIVNNSAMGPYSVAAGGVYVNDARPITMRGNIVVNNTRGGIFRGLSSGGLNTDWDLVWGNSPDYSGVSAGPNSFSVDPQFISATDFRLAAGSPCVDAMPATHLTAAVDVDFEQDPRVLDGNLDGAAILDLGADEFTDARLSVGGLPQLGGSITYGITAPQPSLHLLHFALLTGNTMVPPLGNLLLGGNLIVMPMSGAPPSLRLPIPINAALRGLSVHGQAAVLPLPARPLGRFSNRVSVTVH